MKRSVPEDIAYDQRVDRCLEAQDQCPYFEKREIEIEHGDSEWCLYDSAPCWHGRLHCPTGKF